MKPKKTTPVWPLFVIIAIWTLAVIVAPNEKTIGTGIKPVYVHVALTWMGMLGLFASAAGGIWGLLTHKAKHHRLILIGFGIAVGTYILGYLFSMLSSYVNWGGVPFQEPRFISTLNVIIASAFAAGLMVMLPGGKLKSLAAVLPAIFIFWSYRSNQLVLHPDSAVSTAPLSIKLTFIFMLVLAFFFDLWWFFYLKSKFIQD